MSVHKNYPDGCAPSAGPFDVFISGEAPDAPCRFEVKAEDRLVSLDDPETNYIYTLTPTEARELAAALIECADFIDRASMTTEDIARETRNRC